MATDIGPMGEQLVTALVERVVDAIDQFPGATPEQKIEIARRVAEKLASKAHARGLTS